jgi:hypothetical protein
MLGLTPRQPGEDGEFGKNRVNGFLVESVVDIVLARSIPWARVSRTRRKGASSDTESSGGNGSATSTEMVSSGVGKGASGETDS